MIQHYRRLAEDGERLAGFRRAVGAAVRPGDVVVDVGCGLGTFAVFACQAGAARVWAVDGSAILETAREVVRANGCADRVRFLPGRSTEVDVPERADVAIFEDYPTTLLGPAAVATVQDLAARWLRDGGRLVPARGRAWLAPVEDPQGHQEIDCLRAQSERAAGVDLSPTRRRAFSMLHGRRLNPGALLAAPVLASEVELLRAKEASFRVRARTSASRPGTLHGLLLWFELLLGDEWLSTGPGGAASVWAQTLLPIDPPLGVEERDPVDLRLDAGPLGDELVWRWEARTPSATREGSSLEGMPICREDLARSHTGFVPSVCDDLAVDRAVLELVDGRRPIAEIAATLRRCFPGRFAKDEAAETWVASLLLRHRPRTAEHAPSPKHGHGS